MIIDSKGHFVCIKAAVIGGSRESGQRQSGDLEHMVLIRAQDHERACQQLPPFVFLFPPTTFDFGYIAKPVSVPRRGGVRKLPQRVSLKHCVLPRGRADVAIELVGEFCAARPKLYSSVDS